VSGGSGTVRRGGLPVNAQQLDVVDHVLAEPVTVVVAGAGSGKTHTMVAAALELVERGEATLDQFALITFTNQAADELRERLVDELARHTAADPARWGPQEERLGAAYLGTIHGFCHSLLRTYGYSELVARSSAVTMSHSLLGAALEDALEEALEPAAGAPQPDLAAVALPYHDLQRFAGTILARCHTIGLGLPDLARATEAQPDDGGRRYRVAFANLLERAEAHYQAAKRERGLLDADDLLLALRDLLASTEGKVVVERVAARRPYLFVDEFQDTDRTQKAILDQLSDRLERLVVVGDRKQAIYGFRAADCSLLQELADDHAGGVTLSLSMSKRPTIALLDVQNELFAAIGTRYPELAEPLLPFDGAADPPDPLAPLVFHRVTEPVGPATVARHITSLVGQPLPAEAGKGRPIEAGDVVILARSNHRVDRYAGEVAAALEGTGIDVRRDSGSSWYVQPEIVGTYRVLHMLLQPRHDLSLSLALATRYFSGVDPSDQERWILQYRPREGAPLTDWFNREHAGLAASVEELRRALLTDTAPQLLGRLYDTFPIRERYHATGDELAVENLERLREQARRLFRSEDALTLAVFVDWLRAAILFAREEPDDTSGPRRRPLYVRVMTIHRAKGLEFPVVIIPGMGARIDWEDDGPRFYVDRDFGLDLDIPLVGASSPSDRFEDRAFEDRQARRSEEFRLFYVAVTRAQHQVVLVGGGVAPIHDPDHESYSWRDEVLRAWPRLVPLGALLA
jgi:DNA helicase-2/ATP-dependent DNA helicase PcrA